MVLTRNDRASRSIRSLSDVDNHAHLPDRQVRRGFSRIIRVDCPAVPVDFAVYARLDNGHFVPPKGPPLEGPFFKRCSLLLRQRKTRANYGDRQQNDATQDGSGGFDP